MEVKTQEEVLVELIDTIQTITPRLTDFNVGSVIRSLLDAVSIETESLYGLTTENIEEGIEQGLMSSFGFIPKAPQEAFGYVTIEFNDVSSVDFYIPKSTAFTTNIVGDTNRYLTISPYRVPAGVKTVDVLVYAEQPGLIGNVGVRDISNVSTNIFNVARVYNKEAFTTGNGGETYVEVKKRFALFIESIGRATKNAIKFGALSVNAVRSVYVTEQVGLVMVHAADADGNLTPELQKEVQGVLENYRSAGIELRVVPMKKKPVDVTATIILELRTQEDIMYVAETTRVIGSYINSLGAGNNLIVNDLLKTIFNSNDRDIYDVKLETPNDNIIVDPSEILRSGIINIDIVMRGE